MNRICCLFAAGVLSLALPGLVAAQDKSAPPPSAAAKGKMVMETVRASATIESIDAKTREIILKDSEGKKVEFVAGPEVRNFDQLKKGDVVTIDYGAALAMRLAKTTSKTRARSVTEGMKRAEPGAMPGGVITREVRVVASVEAIDAKASMVTLRGPEHTVSMKVEDPKMLEGVKVGDMVEAVYAEAMAIKVERGTKK
jgi:NADPH-dependent 2,4-dienoyl-CoA reductase/sulfur reductase-like enzyme